MERFGLKKNPGRFVNITVLIFVVIASLSFATTRKINNGEDNKNYNKSIKSIRVAGVKMAVSNDINVNIEAIKKAIDYAQEEKADILLTPEGSLSGYTPDFDKAEAKDALDEIVYYASKAKVGLALGTCFYENDNKCYNQIRFYDTVGNFLGYHS
jgi:sugar phosphate isomerase/epimerase